MTDLFDAAHARLVRAVRRAGRGFRNQAHRALVRYVAAMLRAGR